MSHADPYISTTTMDDLQSSVHASWQPPAGPNDAALDAELAAIRDEARRIGLLLNRIPFLSLIWFFVRIGFAVFFASIVYVFCWWLITAATVGGSASLFLLLSGFLPGQG